MRWARVENGVVIHAMSYAPDYVFPGDPVTQAFYQTCPDEVMYLWLFDGTTWSPPLPIELTQTQLEAALAAHEVVRAEAAEVARIARVTAAIITENGQPTDQNIQSILTAMNWPDDFQ